MSVGIDTLVNSHVSLYSQQQHSTSSPDGRSAGAAEWLICKHETGFLRSYFKMPTELSGFCKHVLSYEIAELRGCGVHRHGLETIV